MVDGVTLGEKIVIVSSGATHYMEYMRDENGEVYGFIYDGSTYFLEKNALGDVQYLLDGSGNVLAQYSYDEWGKKIAVTDANGNAIIDGTNIAHLNPFRYRSYCYDDETGLYYLGSRYYDPQTGRFINADSRLNSGSAISFNLFAYCGNNPIVNVDPDGHSVVAATTIAVGLSVALKLLVTVVVAVVVVEATKAIINNTVDVIDTAKTRREFRQRDDTKADEKEKDIVNPESPESTVIYRYHATKSDNLSPRPGVDYDGLSFSSIPPKSYQTPAVVTTIEQVNATGVLRAVKKGNHVAIVPVGSTAIDWMDQGSSSIWTQTLANIVIEWEG